jgi:phenylacetate-CoA ligase
MTAYGLVLRSRRYGKIFDSTLRTIEDQQWWEGDRLRAYQLEALNRIALAARSSRLYEERGFPDRPFEDLAELASIPVLEKNDLRRPKEILVARSPSIPTLEIHTGGTTGTPLSIHCDSPTLQRNYAFFERFRGWTGFARGARVATFAGRTVVPSTQRRPPFWRRNLAANAMLFSSYHLSPETMPAYVAALAKFRPQLIDSYPSNLELLARFMLQHGITSVRPKSIITSSETLLPTVRVAIEQAFGCAVYDHYGSAEMAAFIGQCDRGRYHVNSDFGIVEILRDGVAARPGESGEIVATGFINPVMPLIRYRTGDSAVVGTGSCDCGRAFPTIDCIEGRMDDYIVTPEGFRVGRLDPIFKAVDSIAETRIVQDTPDHVRLELVAGLSYTEEQGRVLVDELRKRIGPSMRIDLVRVSSIPRTKGGKLRMVVNLVSQ